jgi:hypothetical protein
MNPSLCPVVFERRFEAPHDFPIQALAAGIRGVDKTLTKLLRHAEEKAVHLSPGQAGAS